MIEDLKTDHHSFSGSDIELICKFENKKSGNADFKNA